MFYLSLFPILLKSMIFIRHLLGMFLSQGLILCIVVKDSVHITQFARVDTYICGAKLPILICSEPAFENSILPRTDNASMIMGERRSVFFKNYGLLGLRTNFIVLLNPLYRISVTSTKAEPQFIPQCPKCNYNPIGQGTCGRLHNQELGCSSSSQNQPLHMRCMHKNHHRSHQPESASLRLQV